MRFLLALTVMLLLVIPAWAINTPSGPVDDLPVLGQLSVSGSTLLSDLTVSVTTTGTLATFESDTNSPNSVVIRNTSTGTGARADLSVTNGTNGIGVSAPGVSYTTVDLFQAGHGTVRCGTTSLGCDFGVAASAPVTLWTNAVARLTILGSGLVGIGTVTPSVPLEVVGQISTTGLKITSTTSGGVLVSASDNSNGVTSFSLTNTNTGTGTRAEVNVGNGTGSVGIGVAGVSFTSSGLFQQNYGYVRSSANASGLAIGGGGITPVVFDTSDVERMRILSGGKIGVGTSTPTAAFETSGTISATTYYNSKISETLVSVSGTWTPPADTTSGTSFAIACIGAGGGGGAGGVTSAGTGGGAGAYFEGLFMGPTILPISIVVGTGGGSAANGTSSTVLITPTTYIAGGGSAGNSTAVSTAGGAGGITSNTTSFLSTPGGDGNGSANAATAPGGSGGGGFFGGGGSGGALTANGSTGRAYGSGGGGGGGGLTDTGGSGANGVCRIRRLN